MRDKGVEFCEWTAEITIIPRKTGEVVLDVWISEGNELFRQLQMVVRGREGWNTSAGYFIDDSQQLLEQLNISAIIGIIVQGKEEVTNDMLSTSTLQNRFMLTVIHFPTVFIMVVSWRWKLFSPSLWSAGNASWVIATTMALKCAQNKILCLRTTSQ